MNNNLEADLIRAFESVASWAITAVVLVMMIKLVLAPLAAFAIEYARRQWMPPEPPPKQNGNHPQQDR